MFVFSKTNLKKKSWRKLESFLIQPIQRIPRYQMLVREITSNTKEGHPEVLTTVFVCVFCCYNKQKL
jgi:hypothetical protein